MVKSVDPLETDVMTDFKELCEISSICNREVVFTAAEQVH